MVLQVMPTLGRKNKILSLRPVMSSLFRFLGYSFTTYGWDVFTLNNMNPEDRPDPMNVVFPKVSDTFVIQGVPKNMGIQ